MTGLKLTENAFQKQVIDMAHRLGWLVAHFPTSNPEGRYRTTVAADAKGYPDLTLVRERLLVIECKSATGALRAEQAVWLDRMIHAGVECYIARPDVSGLLEGALKLRLRVGVGDSLLYAATCAEVDRVLRKAA